MKSEQMVSDLNVLNGGTYMNTFKLGLLCLLSTVSSAMFGMQALICDLKKSDITDEQQISCYEKIRTAICSATVADLHLLDGYYKLERVKLGFKGEQLKKALTLETDRFITQLKIDVAIEQAEKAVTEDETNGASCNLEAKQKALEVVKKLDCFLQSTDEKTVGLCDAINAETGLRVAVEEQRDTARLEKVKLQALLAVVTKEKNSYKSAMEAYAGTLAKIESKLTL